MLYDTKVTRLDTIDRSVLFLGASPVPHHHHCTVAPSSISAAAVQRTNLPFELLFQFQACSITGTTCKLVHLGGTTRWAINIFYSENKILYTKLVMVRHFLAVCLILYIIPLTSSHGQNVASNAKNYIQRQNWGNRLSKRVCANSG